MILLVDNDPAVRSALKFSLELDGFSVDAHASGEALAAQDGLPVKGCLVLDQNLPGMSGLDLLAVLRARRIDLPAVLITTHPNAALRRRAAQSGVAIIEKPLLGDTLVQGVRAALERAAATVAQPGVPS
jgi:FixJ family two-component response regulator